jgi:putative FmdB family regulatory protein
MPIYDCYCEKCGYETEQWKKINENLDLCPKCSGKMKKKLTCSHFKLNYNPKTDICDWQGNTSQYYRQVNEARRHGENVKPAKATER